MDQVVVKRLAYSPHQSYDEHAHAETQITLFVTGGVEEKVGDEWCTIGPLEFVIKPAGLMHMNQFWEQGAQTIQISVSPRVAKNWRLADGLSSYRAKFCPFVTRRFLSMYSECRERDEPVASDDQLFELLRSLAPVACPLRDTPHWLVPIVRRIDREYRDNLSVRELAQQYQKHPGSLARAFRAKFGQSIKQRICQLRVQDAAKQLSQSDVSAAEISLACGFSDQSHMSRVFKSVTGLPPGQFRRLVCKKVCKKNL